MELSIIIINWNSAAYLRRCLASIEKTVQGLAYEIIVWDNASYDGSDAIVRNEFPSVRFVQSDRNYGFARANNLAFRYASGEVILFLNPDTEVQDGAVRQALAALRALPDAGAIGCRLLNSDGTLQTSCIQRFPTLLNQLLDFDVLKQRFPSWRLWGMGPLLRRSPVPEIVDMISGACMMMPRSVFQSLGMFTPEYLMYGDDLDLCHKIRRGGGRVYYMDRASVTHHGGKSSSALREGLADVWTRAAVYQFLVATRGALYGRLYRAALAAAALLRIALLYPLSLLAGGAARTRFAASRLRWLRILQWSSGSNHWAGSGRVEAGLADGKT